MQKLKVFVCSPYRANKTCSQEKHVALAKALSRAVVLAGHIPVTPHIYFTSFLDDSIDKERELGLELSKQLLSECDHVLAWEQCCGVTQGMRAELDFAKERKIKYIVLSYLAFHGKPVETVLYNHKGEGAIKQNLCIESENFVDLLKGFFRS